MKNDLTNKMIEEILKIETRKDFMFSDLVINAKSLGLLSIVDKEEDILNCSELFAIEKVVENTYGKMFVYEHSSKISDNAKVSIIRARRKVDITLDYFITKDSTVEEVMNYINRYVQDNKSIIIEASGWDFIALAFFKEYKNIDGIIINREICLLRICFQTAKTDLELMEGALDGIKSSIYTNLLNSNFAKESREYEDELKATYAARYTHIYTNVIAEYFGINIDQDDISISKELNEKIKVMSPLYYSINKELSICDFISENALKMQQFKNNWNNFISIPEYEKVLKFALEYSIDAKSLPTELVLDRFGIITACMLYMFNIDKTTMNLVREARSNSTIQTAEDIKDMYNKAIDISLITSKDLLAAIIDGEKLDVKIEPEKALNILVRYNKDLNMLTSFKEFIINPIIDSIVEDVLAFKLEEKEQTDALLEKTKNDAL